jgi:hypothetical protein
MRLRGRLWLVALVLCLVGLIPARGEAALIDVTPTAFGTVSSGPYLLDGTFVKDNDIALFSFSLTSTATVTAELTSFLCNEPDGMCEDSTVRGFDPILTLLSDDSAYTLQGSAVSVTGNDPFTLPLTLGPGDYLLAITQYNNFYSGTTGGAFDNDTLASFTKAFFDIENLAPCPDFIAFVPPDEGLDPAPECRNKSFAGTLTIESTAVPEPGTLTLLALGGSALIARRRRRTRGES